MRGSEYASLSSAAVLVKRFLAGMEQWFVFFFFSFFLFSFFIFFLFSFFSFLFCYLLLFFLFACVF